MIFTIIGVAGAIGSGKSFTQLKHGLKYCEERQKQLVTNFPIDIEELRKYASMPIQYQSLLGYIRFELSKLLYVLRYLIFFVFRRLGKPKKPRIKPQYPWIKWLCENGGIVQIPFPEHLEALLIPESVVLLDEAGILLNSREFAKTSKRLLADLAQSRKDGCDLIWCAQFDEQVDRQLRLLTQFWIHCESLAVFDKKMRRPKLWYKRIFWFRCSDYQEWLNNPRVRGNHIKTRFVFSTIYEGGLLTKADRQLFKIFDSFSRLDLKTGNHSIITKWHCKLPQEYYVNKLKDYESYKDPFCRDFKFNYLKLSKTARKDEQLVLAGNVEQVESKSHLIKKALVIARAKGLEAPYFKSMQAREIRAFIDKNI